MRALWLSRKAVSAPSPRSRVLIAINTFTVYQQNMIEGILRYARTHAPPWEFVFLAGSVESPGVMIQKTPQCDAILAHSAGNKLLAALRRRKLPAVTIEGPALVDFPNVIGDNPAIGALAFAHLRSKGFHTFACLGYKSELFRERGEGFAAAARAAQQQILTPLFVEFFANPRRELRVRQWIARAPRPLGLFVCNVGLALYAVELCREMRVLVPDEIAVLGVDNDPVCCEVSRPPLSTIDHGMERAGYEAAALLHRLMNGEPPPADPIRVAPVGVIERQSTDTLAVDDSDVRAAVRLIRERATAGLTVKKLLELLPVARRKIETRFRAAMGRSLHQELTRVRLDRAKLLLRNTEMAMPSLAESCGFHYASRLSALFAQEVGMTPTAYRRQHRGA